MNLNDPTNPVVIEALTRRCDMCKAEPGEPCHSLTVLPLERLIHLYRIGNPR